MHKMIKVDLTIPMMKRAKIKAEEMGPLSGSIMKGKRNFIGFLGEEVAMSVIGGTESNTYDYDMINLNGNTIDVKTKLTTVEPMAHYDCSVAAYNTKQKCDEYAFVRIKKDLSCAWFLGIKKKEEYFDDAVFMRKGDIDPSNNFTVRADCYNLRIDNLDNLGDE